MATAEDVIAVVNEVNELIDMCMRVRSVFPTLLDNSIGGNTYNTAKYYKELGYDATITMNKEITVEFIEKHNRLGKWVNENAIIRLYGIMDYHCDLANGIDDSVPSCVEVNLMRKMRNAFTKTKLNYSPENERNIQLREDVIKHFGLNKEKCDKGEIPTDINKVVVPIFIASIDYIKAYFAKLNNNQVDR